MGVSFLDGDKWTFVPAVTETFFRSSPWIDALWVLQIVIKKPYQNSRSQVDFGSFLLTFLAVQSDAFTRSGMSYGKRGPGSIDGNQVDPLQTRNRAPTFIACQIGLDPGGTLGKRNP